MKKRIFASVIVVGLAALLLWGNSLLERTLDAQLAPLLTRELGLPVTLAPIQTRLLNLQARSAKLVMGNAADPAVVATDVAVTLQWSALLQGEIKFVNASANDLMVNPSRWPSSNSPAPQNYNFLAQWLPRKLQLQTGRFVTGDNNDYPVASLHWQRLANGRAQLDWTEAHNAGEVQVKVELHSLPDLLQLAPITLDLSAAITDKPDSAVTLATQIAPAKDAAYSLKIDLAAANTSAHIEANGAQAWSLPGTSNISIPALKLAPLRALIKDYTAGAGKDDTRSTQLSETVPRLQLPVHQSHVVIDEFTLGEHVVQDISFDLHSDEQGLQIKTLTGTGPAGILSGNIAVVSTDEGWTLKLDSAIEARQTGGGVVPELIGSDWLISKGKATLAGTGDTWETLLYSLSGGVSFAGHYHGKAKTPVTFEAQLDNRPGEFALDSLTAQLGKGQISGSAKLVGDDRRKLNVDVKGDNLDLGFLFSEEASQPPAGIALPEYLRVLPELDLNVVAEIANLQTPGLKIDRAKATLERTSKGGKLVASISNNPYGTLDLTFEAITSDDKPSNVQLNAVFTQLDIPELLGQQELFYSHSSGTMNFKSQGEDMKEIFTAMRGESKFSVEIRADNDWQRRATQQETLQFSGNSRLVIHNERIVGVIIDNLDIDSIEQDLTGTLSITADQSPWLVARLKSDKLDLEGLQAMLPESSDKTDDTELVPLLKRLGGVELTLDVQALTVSDTARVSDMSIAAVSSDKGIALNRLDFDTEQGTFKSQGELTWKANNANLDISAKLAKVNLDQFIISDADFKNIPVSGSAHIVSEGSKVADLMGNLTGDIDLKATDPNAANATLGRRELIMKASRLPDGMSAEISSLQWGETELTASLRYHRTEPPRIEIDIHSGKLSLLPWENSYLKNTPGQDDKNKGGKSKIDDTVKASAHFVGDLLLTPLRMFSDETASPNNKLFSDDPLPWDSLKDLNLQFSARLDSLLSNVVAASDLNANGDIAGGKLDIEASIGQLGGGGGDVSVAVDTNATPPAVKVHSTFKNVRGLTKDDSYPRSGMVSLTGTGDSAAALAAHANGLIYLELGKGPFDYANSALLTASLATTVFQTLIPGIDRKAPMLECGITVGTVENGKVNTPYGFAARTNQANLLGHVHIDLHKQTMSMNLDSRSRQGVGISVGSIFSNTIQIKGPLTDPGIVPDTTGLAWRGWAAVMTGGLSLLGESVIKRVLAAEDPCLSIRKMITKELCPTNPIAASSEMVCPKAS